MTYFAESLKKHRLEADLSMQELADKSNVCKSMICKIEKNDTQPTIDVAGKLSNALGKTLSEMLHAPQTAQVIHLTRDEQAVWEDAHKIKRRNISPVFEGIKVEWLQVDMPPNVCISKTYTTAGNVEKIVLVTKGTLSIKIQHKVYQIKKGESFYFDASTPHEFFNPSKETVEYYLVIKHA